MPPLIPLPQERVQKLNLLPFTQRSTTPNPVESNFPQLHGLVMPHVDSFSSIFQAGLLESAVQGIEAREMLDPAGNRIRFWIEDVSVGKPMLHEKEHRSLDRALYPRECRERGVSYRGKLSVKFMWSVNNGAVRSEVKSLGALPIMVRSTRCHLYEMSPSELTGKKEDAEELGGYFIVNGIERIVRLLIVTRRNHVLALTRPSFAKRGPSYTNYGCQVRCVREDQSSQTIYLHYLQDGTVMVRFSYRKNEYLVPLVLILRALTDTDDQSIFEGILQGDAEDTFVAGRVESMLREFKKYALVSKVQCLKFLGEKFHVVLNMPRDTPFEQVGQELLRRIVLVHLEHDGDKFNFLLHAVRKLYALVSGRISPDNPDSPMHQEVMLPGHLYLLYLKEKLDDWLGSLQQTIGTDLRRSPGQVSFSGDGAYLRKTLGKLPSDIGRKLEHFLATGNLVSNTGLDLQQVSGYTIVAERLNFLRYLAHFRSIHRGAFFAELKTTTVRKLLPEAWGFLCPVHTPDGAPCGLLNHLAHRCYIPCVNGVHTAELEARMFEFGVLPLRDVPLNHKLLPVVLDGRMIGQVEAHRLHFMAEELREAKAAQVIPKNVEVAAVPVSEGGLFPGLYLFTTAARFTRPILRTNVSRVLYIGPLEQIYMDIAVCKEEALREGVEVVKYFEEAPTNMLSTIANLTPFCDFNQSPRNMYQCQMGKQSMGTAMHNYPYRTDNKIYRLYTPQQPLIRTRLHGHYGFDDFPNGTNAVVAVLTYTGYDMEDAMILNKSSYERGLAHGCVYKSEFVDVSDRDRRGEPPSHRFGVQSRMRSTGVIDPKDGLPQVGLLVRPDDPLFSVVDDATGAGSVERYKAFEDAYVDQVRVLSDDVGEGRLKRMHLKYRIPRNPIIGDKFSSRHGQKGVCSQKWPSVDMPWTEAGIQPDIIINPHAFPSRMTIGMLIESMAGKSGALHGLAQDATPFCFGEEQTAFDYFAAQLKAAGYNHYGNESMYSGITGETFKADIFIGVVFYQRLRHMVSDKFQVRTTGPVHALTHQPVKGRKRAGGIRLGEMERDSILAHGAAFLLQDRLMNCSDYSKAQVCATCGSLLSPVARVVVNGEAREVECRMCGEAGQVQTVAVPFVLRYLAAELMAMNINLKMHY